MQNILKLSSFFLTLLLVIKYNKCDESSSSNMVNAVMLNNFYITWSARETQTDYIVIANFDNMTIENLWFAIGFNYEKPTMVLYFSFYLNKTIDFIYFFS